MPRKTLQIRADNSAPIPRIRRTTERSKPWRYPWDTMKVDQSFAVPKDVVIGHFRRQAWDAGRKFERKFSVRKVKNGYRCFRLG